VVEDVPRVEARAEPLRERRQLALLLRDRGPEDREADLDARRLAEDQQAAAPTLAVSDVAETTNGTVAMRVNRTFPTGPMEISLFDPGTETPVQGTVTVNGQELGGTTTEGVRWAVEPRGAVTVEATTDDDR
jgi:hypothetical protein